MKYEIYDKQTDRLLAVGTVQEIADKLGFRTQSVRQIITKCSKGDMRKYRVESTSPAYDSRKRVRYDPETMESIKNWNYMASYCRKKYGVARWQPTT